ncbi:dTDP-4-dehydrorhamnose reductase [Yoonia vestfoldensis]|uniref:dTDP-4-dehydrorhamnose reductase n=1 Tax=Yoonia vestfoldensis TaxID=245188 RepID=UPI00036D9ACB|nr:dTDP-4-dehydrorhamnose reductase [Yoonia vestfoldensis]
MRLLVFGTTGQVAKELARRRPQDCTIRFLDRRDADLSDPAACHAAILASDVDAVINAAAWTAVDDAEMHEARATTINADAPGAMAAACLRMNIPLLHLSTDYVFDGAGQLPFAPSDPVAPLSAYGRSKLAGENAIRLTGAHHLILRTSWVFSPYDGNFVTTMLRLGASRNEVAVIADQIGGPTPAGDIADALFVAARGMIGGKPGGTHHFAGAPDTSWANLARHVMDQAGLDCAVRDLPSSDYPALAVRPLNSRLDCASFTLTFGLERPDWRRGVKEVILNLGDKT